MENIIINYFIRIYIFMYVYVCVERKFYIKILLYFNCKEKRVLNFMDENIYL